MSSIDVELESELRGIQTNPINGVKKLRQDFGGFEAKMSDGLYAYIAKVVAVYLKIADDPAHQAAFVALCERKNGRAEIIRRDLLLAVFKYVLKAGKRGPMYERARIYARAMKAAVDARTDPSDIPDLIRQANGIEELYARQVGKSDKRNAANETAAPAFDDEEDGDEDDTFSGQSGQESGKSDRTRSSSISINKSDYRKSEKNKNKPRSIFDEKLDLAITFPSSKDLFKLLESGADGGTILFSFVRDVDAPPKAVAIQWELDR